MPSLVRLHISPFTPDLLALILPISLRDLATDVSFHEIPTFPERNYGFLNLPAMEAQRLRKKVNGSILRGSKVRVDEARPKKSARIAVTEEEIGAEQDQELGEKRAKKRKRQEGVVPGYELKEERKVKRGWTEPVAAKIKEKREKKAKGVKKSTKKQQEPSAYTDDAECLFKTTVPANKQQLKHNDKSKPQKPKAKSKSTVVHEFERTEKHPSFLRSSRSSQKPTAEYKEEVGWLDGSGKIVESKRPGNSKPNPPEPASDSSSEAAPAVDHERLGSLTLHEQEGEDDDDDDDDATSSSGTSSSGSSSGSSGDATEDGVAAQKPSLSVSPAPQISVEQPSATRSTPPHPLESLYKKPALPSTSSDKNKANLSVEAVPFSFFNREDAPITATMKDSVETATFASPSSAKPKRSAAAKLPNLAIPPQTPFTQRDMSWRAQRSAAPTPDTALPRGGFPNLWGRGRASRLSTEEIEEEDDDDDDDDELVASVEQGAAEGGAGSVADKDGLDNDEDEEEEDMQEADDTPIKGNMAAAGKGQSAFAKEFHERRGELNREWKQARREASKSQRAAANRRRKA